MKSFVSSIEDGSSIDIFIFLNSDEIKGLKNEKLSSTAYFLKVGEKVKKYNLTLEVREGSYIDNDAPYEVGVDKGENNFLVYIYNSNFYSKFDKLVSQGHIGGRIGSIYKYDICHESLAKNYDLGSELRFILNEEIENESKLI